MNHLIQIINFTNLIGLFGLFTFWYQINIIPIVCISTYTFAKWTMIGHHTCHGGYDKVGKGTKYNRFIFGIGYRRFIDWFDWFLPEAWSIEHNNLHHFHLGEEKDPDLVEFNMTKLRKSKLPLPIKYIITFILMLTWKYTYYASNTYKELCIHKYEKKTNQEVVNGRKASMIYSSLTKSNHWYSFFNFFCNVIGPYFIFHFILLPLPFLYVNKIYYKNAIVNMILADFLTNIHSFIMIATNHCGSDVCRFSTQADLTDKCDVYLRRITGSVNNPNGNNVIDYIHGYLNYQIEHHLFPDMSMKSYRTMAPKVREICSKYGVMYIQENVFIRLKKTIDIFVGNTSMKVV